MASSEIAAAQRRGTLVGASALLMWSTLALLATLANGIPPFQLLFLTFALAFLLARAWRLVGGAGIAPAAIPRRAWITGVAGLFGYHFLYFMALRAAPPVHVNLLNYLWPLFVVLFAALLPGERLRWWHAGGALLGLVGAAVLVTHGGTMDVALADAGGYALALAGAMTWAAYSVATRRLGDVPTVAVGWFCGVVAALGLLCHAALESWRWPDATEWLAIALLGAGPVGIAFFTWDHGVKRGDLRALGALSYAVPLLGALWLAAAGMAELSLSILAAAALIIGGAALASRDLWGRA